MELKYSKRKQLNKIVDQVEETAYTGPEDDIQDAVDSVLRIYGTYYIRIHSGIFQRLPPSMRKQLAGIPDVMPMIQVSDKYMLCCPVELKNKIGKRHGKQNNWEKNNISFQICRSVEKFCTIMKQFSIDADIVKGLFTAKGLNKK